MKKILVAEDNNMNFQLFCGIFENIEVELLHAWNGKEAVDIYRENQDISLILMDINMPVMNGEDSTILIKEINPDVPIISITAYLAYGSVKEENRKYFCEFIEKPLDVLYLLKLARKYCFDEN